MTLTFHFISFGCILFRSDSLTQAIFIIRKIGDALASGSFHKPENAAAAIWIALILIVEWAQRRCRHPLQIEFMPRPMRWGVYYLVVYLILTRAELNYTPFIYFQF